MAKSILPHDSSRCWLACGPPRRRPSPPRRSRIRSRHPVMAALVAFIARSAAVNLSLTPVTMSSICCRLCRSSGRANLASSSVSVRIASMVRKLRVMFSKVNEAKTLKRRNPTPTRSTPTCHTTYAILPPLPVKGCCPSCTAFVERSNAPLGRLLPSGPASPRPLQARQDRQVVDGVQLAKRQPGSDAGDPERFADQHRQGAEPQPGKVLGRPGSHQVGQLCAQQDEERGQHEDRRDRHRQRRESSGCGGGG